MVRNGNEGKAGYGMAGERRGGKDTVTFLMKSTAVNVRSVVCSKGHAIRERIVIRYVTG